MASTNKTTHYNLSQYVGTDKPTYLVDYNTDMSNIDTGIYNAQAKANTNETSIGDLTELETSVKTNLVSAINEEKGKTDKIGNLSNLTTSANTDLVVAINEVDAEADTNNQNIGTMTNLETTIKTSLVGAVNEVNTKANTIGSLSNLDTTDKTSIVNAINEVRTEEEGTLLWTNSDTTQQFAEQTLSLDLTDYKYVEILYLGGIGSNDIYTQKLYKNDSTEIFKPYFYGGTFFLRVRVIGWENNDLHIYDGDLNGSQNNGACIPYKVIGFKKDY